MVHRHIPDGPIDTFYDTRHLSEEIKLERRKQYKKYFVKGSHIQTAAGKKITFQIRHNDSVLDWVTDENVSIAMKACELCLQINACRPKGKPPFICLHARRGTGQSKSCRARRGTIPARFSVSSSKRKRVDDNDEDGNDEDDSGPFFVSELTEEESEGTDEDGYRWLKPYQQEAARKALERLTGCSTPRDFSNTSLTQEQSSHQYQQLSKDNVSSTLPRLEAELGALTNNKEDTPRKFTASDHVHHASACSDIQKSTIAEICCRQTALLKDLDADLDALKEERSSSIVKELLLNQAQLSDLLELQHAEGQHAHADAAKATTAPIDTMKEKIAGMEKNLNEHKARYKEMLMMELDQCSNRL